MKRLIKGARVWREDHMFEEGCNVLIEGDRIAKVGCKGDLLNADEVIDGESLTLLPGLVDVHTHGRCGYDFCDASAEEMKKMKVDYERLGVTSVMATLASAPLEDWYRAIEDIQSAGFAGIHFEGRYLNPAKKGAHAPELLVKPNSDELQTLLDLVTLPCHVSAALELDEDGSFAQRALQNGATLGLGHTSATAEEARVALSRGATSFTHLFNAMPPLHHREGGAVSVALMGGGYGELIADGVHICPDMIRLAYRCLGGDKTVLITDSMAGTGCPDGDYSIAGMPVVVKNGRALTPDGVIAGSTLNLWDGVKNLMDFADIPLEDAIACATLNPARMVGLDAEVGSILEGKFADLLLVNANNEICRVFKRGETV